MSTPSRRPAALTFVLTGAVLAVGWAGYRVVGVMRESARPDLTVAADTAARVAGVSRAATGPSTAPANALRCAVIGGMTFTGFWDALAERYERETRQTVFVMATGEKDPIAAAFRGGGIDVVTMHSSDTIINLVADGYALDPQPWMRNDLVLVGPPSDPAGVRGMTDAAAALRKIVAAKSPFVMPSSLGAQEVLRNVMNAATLAFDTGQVTTLTNDPQRAVLHVAAGKGAYTVVGRIPFRTGRIPNEGMQVMVQGDPELQRPYVVAVANPDRIAGVKANAARRFALWLRSPDTQAWIAEYGRGRIDDRPLFFPVVLPAKASR